MTENNVEIDVLNKFIVKKTDIKKIDKFDPLLLDIRIFKNEIKPWKKKEIIQSMFINVIYADKVFSTAFSLEDIETAEQFLNTMQNSIRALFNSHGLTK